MTKPQKYSVKKYLNYVFLFINQRIKNKGPHDQLK